MAMRGSPMRRVVGNPLGGVLRDLDRRSRPTTRRRGPCEEEPPPVVLEGPRGSEGPPGPPGPARYLAAAVVATGGDGRARWTYPTPFSAPPALTALSSGSGPTVPVVEEITATYAVVRVWTLAGSPTSAGLRVHLTAAPGPEGCVTDSTSGDGV